MIYLMHGFIGSGKTTKAKELEIKHKAIRLTPDEWISDILGNDPPENIFQTALNGILNKLDEIAIKLGGLELNVILDYGFWTEKSRNEIEKKLISHGLRYEWIICEDDIEICRRRNRVRNELGNTLNITDATFEKLLENFEPKI